ncbi:nuclear transport factor 2 family protein [Streptomyces sp. NRRL S-1022]|uniref:nuclear transport factor 2 family protein n=1 Tax=Streptomyces sp. NRRL S-1022 TaxID=1463880 RepID=UPI00131AE090|nr:hypothetical protein [Streptomyces sp. NRRL S-1022]
MAGAPRHAVGWPYAAPPETPGGRPDDAGEPAEWTSRAQTVHGGTYDNRCGGVFTVRDGRIVSVVEYTDTRHVAATLFPRA